MKINYFKPLSSYVILNINDITEEVEENLNKICINLEMKKHNSSNGKIAFVIHSGLRLKFIYEILIEISKQCKIYYIYTTKDFITSDSTIVYLICKEYYKEEKKTFKPINIQSDKYEFLEFKYLAYINHYVDFKYDVTKITERFSSVFNISSEWFDNLLINIRNIFENFYDSYLDYINDFNEYSLLLLECDLNYETQPEFNIKRIYKKANRELLLIILLLNFKSHAYQYSSSFKDTYVFRDDLLLGELLLEYYDDIKTEIDENPHILSTILKNPDLIEKFYDLDNRYLKHFNEKYLPPKLLMRKHLTDNI